MRSSIKHFWTGPDSSQKYISVLVVQASISVVETPSFSATVLKLERPSGPSSFHTTALCSILAIDDGVITVVGGGDGVITVGGGEGGVMAVGGGGDGVMAVGGGEGGVMTVGGGGDGVMAVGGGVGVR